MKARFVLRRRVFAVGVVAAVAVVVAAGYGWSAITAGDQMYTGCLQSGSITNVAVGPTPLKACPKNALQISWNQQGQQGIPGTNGTSVNSATEPVGVNCANGGSKFTAANGVTYACNGGKGDKGDIGPAGPGLSDISQLDGTPCTVETSSGTVGVTTASDGTISLNCNADIGGGSDCGTEPAAVANSSWACVGTEWQLACDAGYYNADALVSNGCETQPDPWPDSFATASNQGTLNRGQSKVLTGNSVPQEDVDWFTVTFGVFSTASISLVSDSNLFRLEVWDSPTSQLPTAGTSASYTVGATPKQLWIKVYSLSSTLDGSNYALTLASI
jgi:hypothetical protein